MSDTEKHLRRLLCACVCGATAYMDDGEAADCSEYPNIDFLREPVQEIESKLRARGVEKHRQLANLREKSVASACELSRMTIEELRREIGYLQAELIHRVCGDPVAGIGLKVES